MISLPILVLAFNTLIINLKKIHIIILLWRLIFHIGLDFVVNAAARREKKL